MDDLFGSDYEAFLEEDLGLPGLPGDLDVELNPLEKVAQEALEAIEDVLRKEGENEAETDEKCKKRKTMDTEQDEEKTKKTKVSEDDGKAEDGGKSGGKKRKRRDESTDRSKEPSTNRRKPTKQPKETKQPEEIKQPKERKQSKERKQPKETTQQQQIGGNEPSNKKEQERQAKFAKKKKEGRKMNEALKKENKIARGKGKQAGKEGEQETKRRLSRRKDYCDCADTLEHIFILRVDNGVLFNRIFENVDTGNLKLLTRKLRIKDALNSAYFQEKKGEKVGAGEPTPTPKQTKDKGGPSASGGRQTDNGGTQNLYGDTQTSDGGKQTAHGGTQAADGGTQTADGGTQTADGGTQTADGGKQIADAGRQAPDGGRQTADGSVQIVSADVHMAFNGDHSSNQAPTTAPAIAVSSSRSHARKTPGLGSSGLPSSFHEIGAETFKDVVRLIFVRSGETIKIQTEPFAKDVGIASIESGSGLYRGNVQVEKEMERMKEDTMLRGLKHEKFHCENIKHLKKSITCPDCGNVYVYPKVLKCFHMICASCCKMRKELTVDAHYQTYQCKECSETTDFDKWGLLSCFFMTEMARFLYSIMNAKNRPVCMFNLDNCKMHLQATLRCKQCKGEFCEKCFDSHRDKEITHNEFEWLESYSKYKDEYDSQIIKCKRHDEEVELYCNDCNIAHCRFCHDLFHHGHYVELFRSDSTYVDTMKKKLNELIHNVLPKALKDLGGIEKKLKIAGRFYRFKNGEGKEIIEELQKRLTKKIDKSWDPIRNQQSPEWKMHEKRYRNIQIDLQRRFLFVKRLREIGTNAEVITFSNSLLPITQRVIQAATPLVFIPIFRGLQLLKPSLNPVLKKPMLEYPFAHRIKIFDAMFDPSKPIHSITYMNGDLLAVHFDTDPNISSTYHFYCKSHKRETHWKNKLRLHPKCFKFAFFQKEKTKLNKKTEKLLTLECCKRKDNVYKNDFEVHVDDTSYHTLRAFDADDTVEDYCTDIGSEIRKPITFCALNDEGFAYFTKGSGGHAYFHIFESPFMTDDKLKIDNGKLIDNLTDPCAACYAPHQHVFVLDKHSNKVFKINYFGQYKPTINVGSPETMEVMDMCSSHTHLMVLARYKNDNKDNIVYQYSIKTCDITNRLTRDDGLEHGTCLTWNGDDKTIYVGCDDGKIREFKFPDVYKFKERKECCDKKKRVPKVTTVTQTPY